MAKIRVLIVDDSALIRKLLTEILSSDKDIEVVGAAPDPYIAREKIKVLTPDVLTLDVEMPRMDGITFLKNLMRLRPMPVVMVSTLTEQGAEVTLQALELGAIDFVSKPKVDVSHSIKDYACEVIEKVKMAAAVSPGKLERRFASAQIKTVAVQAADQSSRLSRNNVGFLKTTESVVAIGSSTGGTEAVKEVLMALPASCPGIVVAQHIPVSFSGSFAKRLNACCALRVAEARDGDQILPGHAFIAPGDKHLVVERTGARYICRLRDSPEVNRHKPSVEVLFKSVAKSVGPNAMGIMLTGMGADGAKGMLEMKESGAFNVAQDEKTSVVWGMPGSAVKLGAVDKVIPLEKIADEIVSFSLAKVE